MNCLYCQKELPIKDNLIIRIQYDCDNCDVGYYISKDEHNIVYWEFLCEGYRFEFWTRNPQFLLSRKENMREVIWQTSYHPDITPSNARQKLKTILAFQ